MSILQVEALQHEKAALHTTQQGMQQRLDEFRGVLVHLQHEQTARELYASRGLACSPAMTSTERAASPASAWAVVPAATPVAASEAAPAMLPGAAALSALAPAPPAGPAGPAERRRPASAVPLSTSSSRQAALAGMASPVAVRQALDVTHTAALHAYHKTDACQRASGAPVAMADAAAADSGMEARAAVAALAGALQEHPQGALEALVASIQAGFNERAALKEQGDLLLDLVAGKPLPRRAGKQPAVQRATPGAKRHSD